MFSFKNQQPRNDMAAILRRITDLTSPNVPPLEGDDRSEDRYNRSLPALVAPWENGSFDSKECVYGITKDVSDRGVALVLHQPFRAAEVVVGFWPVTAHHPASDSSPFFVIGEVRENVALGGGFWQLCLCLSNTLTDSAQIRRLTPLAAQLVPRKAIEEPSLTDVIG
jgi:hypothetical protein